MYILCCCLFLKHFWKVCLLSATFLEGSDCWKDSSFFLILETGHIYLFPNMHSISAFQLHYIEWEFLLEIECSWFHLRQYLQLSLQIHKFTLKTPLTRIPVCTFQCNTLSILLYEYLTAIVLGPVNICWSYFQIPLRHKREVNAFGFSSLP